MIFTRYEDVTTSVFSFKLYWQKANAVGVRAHTEAKMCPSLKGHLPIFETDKILIKLIFHNILGPKAGLPLTWKTWKSQGI